MPHCSVKWFGDDLEWFGCPYFVVPALEGDVVRVGPGEWGAKLSPETRRGMARQAMTALVGIHRVDPAQAAYLGGPIPFAEDVKRWDRFYERAADPERLALVPRLRERLLTSLPENAPTGVFHRGLPVVEPLLFLRRDAPGGHRLGVWHGDRSDTQ